MVFKGVLGIWGFFDVVMILCCFVGEKCFGLIVVIDVGDLKFFVNLQ